MVVAEDHEPCLDPELKAIALARWSSRLLLLLALGTVLWFAGAATASADETSGSRPGFALTGTVESARVDVTGAVAELPQVDRSLVAEPVQQAVAPVVAVLDRTPLAAVTTTVGGAVDLADDAVGSTVRELSRTATAALQPAARELRVAVPAVVAGLPPVAGALPASPTAEDGSTSEDVAVVTPTLRAAHAAAAGLTGPRVPVLASAGTAGSGSTNGPSQLPGAATPAPAFPSRSGGNSSSGGQDVAADLSVAVPGARSSTAPAAMGSSNGAIRDVALDPSFSPD